MNLQGSAQKAPKREVTAWPKRSSSVYGRGFMRRSPNVRFTSAVTAGCNSSRSEPRCRPPFPDWRLIFLGWVAFATVNVIFKDRIIASKDHRYQQMQWTYENRVADLQLPYDELNGALVAAEDRFKSTADELEPNRTPSPSCSAANRPSTRSLNSMNAGGVAHDVKYRAAGQQSRLAAGAGAASDSVGMDAPLASDPAKPQHHPPRVTPSLA